ncbi:ATP-binding protein [Tolypothrix sp. VBCCA 56010]|uniref:ATP-binding protein n=1 Tax=Tolypothrix sp. VBCCA 56010 TaxID=3137731 RepID=UPI003D7DDDEE
MQRPQKETVTLEDIVITEELSRRNPRPANLLSENQALHTLARQLVNKPETMLQSLVDMALELCSAQSTGVSLLEVLPSGEEVFRWNVLAGALKQYVGGTTPRNFSPCGTCLDRGTPVLYSYPGRYFTSGQEAITPVVEVLVLPLIADNQALGAIWIVSHDEQRHFDSEDVRVMTSLADFTAATLLLNQRQTKELLATNATLETEIVQRKQAQEQSRALIENLPGGAAFVVDRNLRYLLAEGEALSAAEFKSEDFVGKTIFEVLPPELATYYEVLYRQGLAGEPFELEHDAHNRSFISRGTPLRSADGEVYAVLAVSYDITDRKEAEAAITKDLRGTQLLRDLSARVTTDGDIQVLYDEILTVAMALTQASAGTVQILDQATQELIILANQGFEQTITDHFYRVNASSNTPCGQALFRGDRTFVDFDVPESEDPDGSLRILLEAGYLSAQSTPLITRSGKLLGMFSTHWRKHYRPSDRELRFLDLLARQAADLIEQRQAQEALHESEEKFRTFVSAASDIIYEMSADWREMHFLKGKDFITTTENSRHEWTEEYIPETDKLQVWAAINRAIATRSNFELKHRVIRLDGTVGWTFSRAIPLIDETGEIVKWFGAASDITEQKQAEIALRESEAKYRSLFNSIDDGFCIVERVAGEPINFRYVEANPAFAVQTGVSDIVGKTIREAFADAPEAEYEIYENVLNTGEPLRFETNVSSLERTLEIYAFRIEGEPRLAFIFKDISDRKRHDANFVFLAEVTQDLARLTNIDETMNALGEKIGGYFNLSACVFAELSETAEIAVINYTWQLSHMPSFIGTYRMQDFVTPEVLQLCRAGEAVVIRDVFADPLVDGEQYAALNIGSFLSIPLVRDGEWRFLLVIYHTEPHDWRDDEIELTRELANRIWTRLERARAEVGLRQSEEKYRLLFNSINEGYALCELLYDDDERAIDWKILQVNPAFESLTGLRDVAGKNATQLNQRLNQNWLQTFGTVAQTGESTRFEHYIDSVDYWFEILVSRIDEDKHHIVVVFNNITDRKQAQADQIRLNQEQAARQQERQRAEALADLDRSKTAFFSNVSHEFRTPLTLLLAPLQDALSDRTHPLPQAQQERLELAHRNAIRLLKLVNTLLDFSRIEAGRMEAVYEPTDLALFTTELASVFRSAIERAGLRLVVDCPPLAEPVYVDREMWEKIVLNLLSNAFKFTKDGEIAVRLHLADDHHVTLQVEDTGSGIEPEELPHLMERFYQVRVTKARTHEGSGIGLALVQELIKMHGGTVEVSSTPGVGSCFTVTIPLGTAHLPSDRLRLDVGDRTTATRTLTSTALGAAPYVQEAKRWLLQDSDTTEVGEAAAKTISANSKIISANSKIISTNSKTISANSKIISTNSETISANSETISANSETISANSKTISTNSKTISANSKTISTNSETKTSFPNSPAHILIVDDNADMRDYLKRILSEHDVEVEAVADGAAALAIVTERVPSLVLSDVMMPLLDGFELLKALRADARTKEVPIILLSARAGEESVIEGLQAGADDYLIKPFSATELVTRVLAHLQMAQLRSQALHQEKTINRMKDKFLAEVSHELNTPLVAILGWTRLLRSSQPSQAMLTKSLETIERNATLQAKLVQDLLDISRITAGKINLNLQPVELQQVIENAIATVRQSLETKDIRLECLLDPSPTIVQGDPDRLQQIILNLLTNAVKFTPQKGRIKVCVQTNETQAQISVSDTGCGIDAEFLSYIFETFRQASSSKKGLGLGLAIARNLIELHGGTIHAQSPGVGQGATFIIELPLIIRNS